MIVVFKATPPPPSLLSPVVTAGGTSLAGQTVGGRGVVVDTSRHMNVIQDIDLEARRVRVGPGVVQEDLNRAARPRPRFRPGHLHGEPGHDRRDDWQQLVGQPVDRLRDDDRPRLRARGGALSDGTRTRFAPLDEAEWARRAASPASRARSTGGWRRSSATTATPSPATTPSTGARPAATAWIAWRPTVLRPRPLRGGLRGHARGSHRGHRRPHPLRGQAVRRRALRLGRRGHRRHRRPLQLNASAIGLMAR